MDISLLLICGVLNTFILCLYFVYALHAHCFRCLVLLHAIYNKIEGFKNPLKMKIQTIKQQ